MEQCEKEAHSFHLFVSHSVPTPWVSLHLATSTNRQTAPDGGESGVELEQEQEEEEEEEQESSNQPRTLPCPRWSWSRTRASCNFIPSVVHWVFGLQSRFWPWSLSFWHYSWCQILLTMRSIIKSIIYPAAMFGRVKPPFTNCYSPLNVLVGLEGFDGQKGCKKNDRRISVFFVVIYIVEKA